MIKNIPIESVRVPARRARPLGDIVQLASSIREIGLLNPITVSEDYTLISGLHRLEACKVLQKPLIAANVVPLNDLKRELAEIDENLVRHDLTVLERSEHLARRKEIYEALHPQAKHGGAPGKAGGGKAKAENISSFADETAAAAGVTPRTVRQEVQIAEGLSEDVKEAIRGSGVADRKADLLALARVKEPEKQKEIAEKLVSGEARNFSEATDETPAAEDRRQGRRCVLEAKALAGRLRESDFSAAVVRQADELARAVAAEVDR